MMYSKLDSSENVCISTVDVPMMSSPPHISNRRSTLLMDKAMASREATH